MIDAHCQLGPGLRTKAAGALYEVDTAEKLLAIMDKHEIQHAVVFAPSWLGGSEEEDFIDPSYEAANAAVAEAVSANPNRLTGFAHINPKFGKAAARELERCFDEYGFRGLRLDNEADGFDPTQLWQVGPLAEICRNRNAPILVKTGFHPCESLLYLPLAQAFPDVNIILGHMGGRLVIDAVITAQRSPNVYLETSGQMPGYILNAVRAVGASRVIFGTDIPFNIPDVELRRIRSIGLAAEDYERITRGNIETLLGVNQASPKVSEEAHVARTV